MPDALGLQIEQAIEIAWDPRSDQSLKAQAFDYLNQLRSQPEAWSLCLPLAIRDNPPSEVVRHVSLEIVNNAVTAGQLNEGNLATLSRGLLGYIENKYGGATVNSESLDPVSIQNKLTQTVTSLFAVMYETQWAGFFQDVLNLTSSSGSSTRDNAPGTIMYLRILIAVHEQIADVMVSKTPEEQRKDMRLKDLVRERDIGTIAGSWHEILAQWRGKEDTIIELCLTCIGKWVSWTDISLAVNDSLLSLLFELLSPHMSGEQGIKVSETREAAIETFVELLAKKMSPSDKLELIEVLKVNDAITQLVNGRSLSQQRHTSDYDTDLAEDVAKLVNNAFTDICKGLDSAKDNDSVSVRGNSQLRSFLPHVLRFLSDEYDEICSTVLPCLTDFLALMKRKAKNNSGFLAQNAFMLPMILDGVTAKVKYDETAVWGNEDTQTDEAEFQDLRKRLHTLQQAVAAVDENLYTRKITDLVLPTFETFKQRNGQVDWRDLELALHELYLFGELGMKNGGLYSKTKPVSPAAEQLIGMMFKLMESGKPFAPLDLLRITYILQISLRHLIRPYSSSGWSCLCDITCSSKPIRTT